MKISILKFLALAATLQLAEAHYRFHTLLVNDEQSTAAVRLASSLDPIYVQELPTLDMACNRDLTPATETKEVEAGSFVGLSLDPGHSIFHDGPGAMYLGRVPPGETAATWDGSGKHWFKIEEWGRSEDAIKSNSLYPMMLTRWPPYYGLNTTLPKETPSGEYLLRAEHLNSIMGPDSGGNQYYVGCAQIKVVNGGNGTPGPLVDILTYVDKDDINVRDETWGMDPKIWTHPGPPVWKP